MLHLLQSIRRCWRRMHYRMQKSSDGNHRDMPPVHKVISVIANKGEAFMLTLSAIFFWTAITKLISYFTDALPIWQTFLGLWILATTTFVFRLQLTRAINSIIALRYIPPPSRLNASDHNTVIHMFLSYLEKVLNQNINIASLYDENKLIQVQDIEAPSETTTPEKTQPPPIPMVVKQLPITPPQQPQYTKPIYQLPRSSLGGI